MAFNVQENAVFIRKFSKKRPIVGGENPPTPHVLHPPPVGSLRSLVLPPPPPR